MTERDRIVDESDALSMLGKEVVIPTGCILEIIKRSQYIKSEADIYSIPGLRKDFVSQIYGVFASFFSSS